jgi:hypothetical protein
MLQADAYAFQQVPAAIIQHAPKRTARQAFPADFSVVEMVADGAGQEKTVAMEDHRHVALLAYGQDGCGKQWEQIVRVNDLEGFPGEKRLHFTSGLMGINTLPKGRDPSFQGPLDLPAVFGQPENVMPLLLQDIAGAGKDDFVTPAVPFQIV